MRPSGWPRISRVFGFSMCTSPGATMSQPAKITPPTVRAAPTVSSMTSPGSILGSLLPSCSPPWDWKYHHGMPFITKHTSVSGPSSCLRPAAIEGSDGAFTATKTASCGPSVAGSSVATTRALTSRRGAFMVMPLWRIVARFFPRAIIATSAPPRDRRAARLVPTAPAP